MPSPLAGVATFFGVVSAVAIDRAKILQEAQKHVAKNRLDRAVVEYQKLIRANPREDRIMLKVAELQMRMRAYDAAVASYEQVATHYVSEGYAAKAIAIYKQIRSVILQYLPDAKARDSQIVDKLANLYIGVGLRGDAIALYQEHASQLERAGRNTELLPVYRNIIDLNANDLDARHRLVQALRTAGMEQDADDNQLIYANHLLDLGRVHEGITALEEVSQRRPEDAELSRRLADLYLSRNGAGDAVRALARMVASPLSTRRDIDTLRGLARTFRQLGQTQLEIETRGLMVKVAVEIGDIERAHSYVTELLADYPYEPGVRELGASFGFDTSLPPVPMPGEAIEEEAPPSSIRFSEESFLEASLADEDIEVIPSSRLVQSSGADWHSVQRPRGVGSTAPPLNAASHDTSLRRVGLSASQPVRRRSSVQAMAAVVSRGGAPRPGKPPTGGMPAVPPPPGGLRSPLPNSTQSKYSMNRFPPPPKSASFFGHVPAQVDDFDLGAAADSYERFGEPSSYGDDGTFGSAGVYSALASPAVAESSRAVDTERLARAVSVQGHSTLTRTLNDDIEEALEEADFFASQGLYDDALAMLLDLIPLFPGHPVLVQRMQAVKSAAECSEARRR